MEATKIPENAIPVLDKGYVRLLDWMGTDLTFVNAARVSFMKESLEITERDIRLIKFLAREDHTSPFRHAVVSFEVKAPLMVARQWFKYRVGHEHGPDTAELLGICVPEELQDYFWNYVRDVLGFVGVGDDAGFDDLMYARNEASRRYYTLKPEFYIPKKDQWRKAPKSKKQGSDGYVSEEIGEQATKYLEELVELGVKYYNWALDNEICGEMARFYLPAYCLYTVWRWTCSFHGFTHFLHQRMAPDAQKEISMYANACYLLVKPLFPLGSKHFVERKELEKNEHRD